ncbi:MAG TPA: ABC transporter ATP-binding protein [Acidimicrobiia bacterium]|nr:ABC transporter ATP-binding protein [Acidimicrobiia bacterium]
MGEQRLLEVENLSTSFTTEDGIVRAVSDVSFHVDRGEVLAVVGESGSGKSVMAMSLMRLLPKNAFVTGWASFEGRDLLSLSEAEMRKIRGRGMAMIFQDPMTALNPVFTVGNQIAEAVRVHQSVSKPLAMKRAVELLDLVGIPEPGQRVDSYPHEFSGGMRQRAVIAMAISNDPQLLIADEPTTALDVTIQAQVLEVIITVQRATGAAMLLITHDLGLVAGVADRVQVMYGGRVFESGDTRDVYYGGNNPYTRALMRSVPRLDERTSDRLSSVPGTPPSLIRLPRGCVFWPRCEFSEQVCRTTEPELIQCGTDHVSRCHFATTLPEFEYGARLGA